MASPVPEMLLHTLEKMKRTERKSFLWHLTIGVEGFKAIPRAQLEKPEITDTVDKMVQRYGHSGAADVTLVILKKIDQNQLAKELEIELKEYEDRGKDTARASTETKNGESVKTMSADEERAKDPAGSSTETKNGESAKAMPAGEQHLIQLRSKLMQEYGRVLIGNTQRGHKKLLDDVYTDLIMVPNESGGVIDRHEIHLNTFSNRSVGGEYCVQCTDIFKTQSSTSQQNWTVLTMGIAGVGKTMTVSKFICDWLKKAANQDISFIFPLSFRELNLKKDKTFSLIELLNLFFFNSNSKLESLPEDDGKVLFIFDGLDECRFPLCFGEELTDVHENASVGSLIANLVSKKLLPSALIWITCQPAAAHMIPRNHVDLVTEVRGFSDEQKETYFNKYCNGDVAMKNKIISHIKKSRSLHIMCQIPVFCWILATVLQPLMVQGDKKEIPATLTGIYTNFLLQQKNEMKHKYEENHKKIPETDRIILKLGKLAFRTLESGGLIFYEDDLRECGIDVINGTVFSGLCTQIFNQQGGVSERNIFSFVHLSVQECLAALYVHFKYCNSKRNVFEQKTICNMLKCKNKNVTVLHKYVVDTVLKSENGHLDLFLRFLLGFSLESNQSVLKELLPKLKIPVDSVKDTTNYIKEKLKEMSSDSSMIEQISSDRNTNLLHCLSELKDNSLTSQIQNILSSGQLSSQALSSTLWSVLVFVLLMSEELEEKFELRKYRPSDEGLKRLLPVVKNTRRALLDHCNLSKDSCQALASVFNSDSPLRELDLSHNNLLDAANDLLSAGLSSPHCKLEVLRLAWCNLTLSTCEALVSVLQLENSHLKELDLSNNDLRDSGVNLLSDGLRSSHCKLEILRLSGCIVAEEGCSSLASALNSNPSHLKELDLTYNHPGHSGEKLLLARLKDPHCKLETLRMEHAGKIRLKPGLLVNGLNVEKEASTVVGSRVTIRGHFTFQYSCELTLVPHTAHKRLSLSDGNRKVTIVREPQSYPDHEERFDYWEQVLCSEGLAGRCYWECEWSGWRAEIAMMYKRIGRKGAGYESRVGWNEMSWSLDCSDNTYCAQHNKEGTDIPGAPSLSRRIGVYLDWSAGTLSFYGFSSEKQRQTRLHTFYSRFAEPLYVGFRINEESSVCLCPIE